MKQLRKYAAKVGVEFSAKDTQEKLVAKVKKAVKEQKSGKAKAKEPEAQAEPPALPEDWPKEWPEENHAAYFQTIVKAPIPKDKSKAWAKLSRVIEEKAVNAEPIKLSTGYACFGLMYAPKLVQCNTACLMMPLCKRVCESRPELRDRVAELEQAAKELAGAQSAEEAEAEAPEAAQAPEAPKKTKGKGKAKAKPKAAPEPTQEAEDPVEEKEEEEKGEEEEATFSFTGDLGEYDEEAEVYGILTWMSKKKKPFTMAALIKKVDEEFEDPEEAATTILQGLLKEGDVKQVSGGEVAA